MIIQITSWYERGGIICSSTFAEKWGLLRGFDDLVYDIRGNLIPNPEDTTLYFPGWENGYFAPDRVAFLLARKNNILLNYIVIPPLNQGYNPTQRHRLAYACNQKNLIPTLSSLNFIITANNLKESIIASKLLISNLYGTRLNVLEFPIASIEKGNKIKTRIHEKWKNISVSIYKQGVQVAEIPISVSHLYTLSLAIPDDEIVITT